MDNEKVTQPSFYPSDLFVQKFGKEELDKKLKYLSDNLSRPTKTVKLTTCESGDREIINIGENEWCSGYSIPSFMWMRLKSLEEINEDLTSEFIEYKG